jgi:hypothetical protein
MKLLVTSLQFIADSAVDVLPIAVFLFAFQRLVIGEPMHNWKQIVVGFLFVVVGLGLFLEGLEQTLFPLGRLMAQQLTDPDFLHEAVGRGPYQPARLASGVCASLLLSAPAWG